MAYGLVRNSCCGKPANGVGVPPCGFVGLLPKRRCARLGSQRHLLGHDAVYADPAHRIDIDFYLPTDRSLVAKPSLWSIGRDHEQINLILTKMAHDRHCCRSGPLRLAWPRSVCSSWIIRDYTPAAQARDRLRGPQSMQGPQHRLAVAPAQRWNGLIGSIIVDC